MKTTTKVHRNYQPLTVTVSLEVDSSSQGGLTQQYDTMNSEYVPNRSATPLIITPVVNAIARDGSWENGNCNGKLGECVWYYRHGKIQRGNIVDTGFGTMLSNTTSTNGRLSLTKNIESGKTYSIWFEAVLVDSRFDTNIQVKSEELILTTNEKAIDEVTLTFREPLNQIYNPFLDKYSMALYAKSKGLISTIPNGLEYDANSCLRYFTPLIHIGKKLLTDDEAIQMYNDGTIEFVIEKYNASTDTFDDLEVFLTCDSYPDVIYGILGDKGIQFNCLVMGDSEIYKITLLYNHKERSSVKVSFTRNRPAFDVQLTNKSPVEDNQKRKDQALITYNGGKIEYEGIDCSEAFLNILWLTSTKYNTDVEHCYGIDGILDLSKVTIGKEINGGGYLETSVDVEFKGKYELATDASGEAYTNGDDIAYII